MNPELTVVIVSYRSRDVLGPCLESLDAARAEVALEVVVVDNASNDGTSEWLRTTFAWVMVIDAGDNRGYGAGVNRGAAHARGAAILILNPDCVVPSGTLPRLLAALSRAERVGAIAPALVDESGRPMRSCGRFPTLWTLFCEHLGVAALFPSVAALCGSKLPLSGHARSAPVAWASGAALLVGRQAWNEVGGFDEAIFLFLEEVDWCRRASLIGWRIEFDASARIVHLGQRSSKQVPRASYLHNLRSRVYYMAKHHSRFAAQVTSMILGLSMLTKWVAARLMPGNGPAAGTYAAGLAALFPRTRSALSTLGLLVLGTLLALLAFGPWGRRIGDGTAFASDVSWASIPRASGPSRIAYFYEYMPFSHLDSLAAAGFDGAVIHSLSDSTTGATASRVLAFCDRGRSTGVDVTPQWALQQPTRLAATGSHRRYTWGMGSVESDVACPLDTIYWRSALLDRALEVLAANPTVRRIAVDLEFHRGTIRHYAAGPCRCGACLREYLGDATDSIADPSRLRGLHGWQEARVTEILRTLLEELARRHPGIDVGVFDLDLDSFVHRGFARALAASGLPVTDYCERSYSSGASALAEARSRLDQLGLSRARLVGGIWLKRFAPNAAARAAGEIRSRTDGHFVFTTFSLWLDPRELSGPYTLAGPPEAYWQAFRQEHAIP